jgi:hypothetical protein
VGRDGDLRVAERIVVFFESPRHGIYRDIPVRYNVRTGLAHDLRFELEAVLDPDGRPQPVQTSREGRNVRIRIGDPHRTVQGERTYILRYRVRRAVDFFPDHDELYWNVTGHEWAVPIAAAAVRVHLPDSAGTALRGVTWKTFAGPYGSTDAAAADAAWQDGTLQVQVRRALEPWEGLTVAVGWSKGVVEPPGALARLGELLALNGPLLLPVAVGAWMLRRWRRHGRDPAAGRSVAVQYEAPPGLGPAEMGALLDERADLRDLTAAVIDLAVRGWLRIEVAEDKLLGLFERQDVTLVRLQPPEGAGPLKDHEAKLLAGLFERGERVRIADLRQRFYKHLPGLRSSLYAELVQARLFDASPETVRQRWIGLGIAVLVAGVVLAVLWVRRLGLVSPVAYVPPLVGAGLSGELILAGAPAMPRRTRRGVEMLLWSRGLEEFIERVEAHRLQVQERTGLEPRQLFERLLPYALVLGLGTRWGEAFRDLAATPPTWYRGPVGGQFDTRNFVGGLQRMNGTLATSMAAAPRSSTSGGSGLGGGGFSGGGRGGGGGGAW